MIGLHKRYNIRSSLQELKEISIYRPARAKGHWKGCHHSKLMEQVLTFLTETDMEIKGVKYCLSRYDTDFAFSCNIIQPERRTMTAKIKGRPVVMFPAFGLIASNNMRKRLTFYAGWSNVNGLCSFVGAKWLGPKYTANANQTGAVKSALEDWDSRLLSCQDTMNRLSRWKPSDNKIDKLLIEAGRLGLAHWASLPRIIQMLTKYRIKPSAWNLLIEFSRAVVMNAPLLQMNQNYDFAQLLLSFAPGLVS